MISFVFFLELCILGTSNLRYDVVFLISIENSQYYVCKGEDEARICSDPDVTSNIATLLGVDEVSKTIVCV